MPLNITYHFHEIKIIDPAFSEFYFKLFKKVNYPDYREFIIKGIKNQLKDLILSGKETGVRIEPEADIYKPLKKKSYPFDGVVYILRELGSDGEKYLDNFGNDASLKLTPKGKKWVMDLPNAGQVTTLGGKLNYFDIPEAASQKLTALLTEINNLTEIEPHVNLIGHQLRTILILILRHVCKNILKTEIPSDKRDLRQLLSFTIDQCSQQKNKHLAKELTELRDSKYKDIIDDVIHDDHTTAKPRIVEKMLTHIIHILSLAYRS